MRFDLRAALCLAVPLSGALSVAGCEGDTGGSGGDGPGKEPAAVCDPEGITIGPAPLRRLSRTEYLKTVRDLIPRRKGGGAEGIVEYPLNKIVL